MATDFKLKTKWEKYTVLALRFVVGATFVVSGFVKAVDLWGVEYKIADYLTAFGWDWAKPYIGIVAVMLPLLEFLAGLWLFIGSFRRFTVWLMLAMMAFLLPLSAYIAFANPVADCGCFGEAFVVSNGWTLVKNILITAALVFLLPRNHGLRSIYGPAVQWITVLLPAVYLLLIMIVGYNWQPIFDFRPYKIGTTIADDSADRSDFLFTYEKDGERRDFDVDNLPDSTWTFVDRKQVEVADNDNLRRIAIYDGEEEVTDDVRLADGDVLLLLISDISQINVAYTFKLNELYNNVSESGVNLICLTGNSESEIVQWREMSMADYPIYTMDSSELKSLARGNPAVVWLRDGTVVYKSTMDSADIDDILSGKPADEFIGRELHMFIWLTTLLFAAMALLLFINRSPLLIKLTKRLRKNQNKELPLHQNSQNQLNNHKQQTKMRKNIVAGNWKMNTTLQEGVALAKEVNEALKTRTPNCDVIIGVPFTHLASVAAAIDTDKLGLSAENCADKVSGAYTGEVSAAMVASTGAKYVILGHSERRQYYHETAEILKEKVVLALANGLTPIFCIGEVLEERENGTYFDVVKAQVEGSLFDLSAEDFGKIVLAYEPVWAIGTGKTATADQAQEIHAFIRKTIADKYGAEVAENTSILYGGSCKPTNAKELFAKPDVDGGLIGGAALKADSFMGIVDAF
ncbi:MAG: triose-phosphate isomerase [Bacteroidales bacterium]|nr:triose-phosphate isomerase [Bacteroidales bacterium]